MEEEYAFCDYCGYQMEELDTCEYCGRDYCEYCGIQGDHICDDCKDYAEGECD